MNAMHICTFLTRMTRDKFNWPPGIAIQLCVDEIGVDRKRPAEQSAARWRSQQCYIVLMAANDSDVTKQIT